MKVTIGPYIGPKSKRQDRLISVKIHKYDTWNMDCTLAYIISPMLKQLKETAHGAPLTDNADVPEALRSSAAPPPTDHIDAFHFDRWQWILDEMIWAFDELLNNSVTDTDSIEDSKKIQDRQLNGFRLFGKYYINLWD